MPVDKVELLLKSLEKRVTDVEKHVQKAPAGDPGAMAKRVNKLEKAVAQLKLSVAGKKDQKTEDQQVEKKVLKMLNDVHLDQKLKVLEVEFDTKLMQLRMALRASGARV